MTLHRTRYTLHLHQDPHLGRWGGQLEACELTFDRLAPRTRR